MSMQNIIATDLVHDEYGNYYEVVGIQKDGETLKAIEVSNLYFEKSFQQKLDPESVEEQYHGREIGVLLQDMVNDHIKAVHEQERPIYALRDLLINRIAVYAMDITKAPNVSEQGK